MNQEVDMKDQSLTLTSPGKILYEKYMLPNGLSVSDLARNIDVSPEKINGIIDDRRAISADIALRLGEFFDVSPRMWLELQLDYSITKCSLNSPELSPASMEAVA
ncbi:plasmid maintenance system antidote protein [Syntrophus aciditrophicus SB]|uniref:Plasmid maintenance system antidote protein n=2 Tax=Syntrophus TaxID=43773 RepID=Q2LWI7_SYNAS|nr:plasmid maintenance system antidote protein [Syntrophus aciditrophicus SB]